MQNQKTIVREVSLSGIGLHTGNKSSVRFSPGEENSGIVFVRGDLSGKPSVKADFKHVTGVIRGTTLSSGLAQVHTVEHICSAVYGLGIDNLVVELSANEPPVLDGSSKGFADALLNAGLCEQSAEKQFFELSGPVSYKQGETEIKIEPADALSIDCILVYDHPMMERQEAEFVITPETYAKEIAPARTFCFDYEVEALKRGGLARGGSLDNAIVIGMDEVHNKEGKLRFPNEFVRHKILDFIGDLFLLGSPIKGKITAVKIGHGHNVNFVKELLKIKTSV